MLLSRVAQDLYWMGRYLERAENCSRQMEVTGGFYLELAGLDDERAAKEWQFLSHCFPVADGHNVKVRKNGDVGLAYLNYFLLDPENDVSVLSSITNARASARAVSEALTREVVFNINEAYRSLKSRGGKPFRDKGRAIEAVGASSRRILTVLGAIENTQTRDQGWWYHKLGEAIERTRRTLIVLGARLPALEELSEETSSPLHFAGWRNLLANLASLENYRQIHGPQFHSRNVVSFLLFNANAPRSVLCGVQRMRGYLDRLPDNSPGVATARKEVGRFVSTLQYDDERILADPEQKTFIEESIASLNRLHAVISNPDLEL